MKGAFQPPFGGVIKCLDLISHEQIRQGVHMGKAEPLLGRDTRKPISGGMHKAASNLPPLRHRLPYPPSLRPFRNGLTVIIGGAIFITLALPGIHTSVYVLYGLVLALVWGVERYFGAAGTRADREAVRRFAFEAYDIVLSNAQARVLTTPATQVLDVYGDWSSQAVNVLYATESGEETYLEVRLSRRGAYWFLFSLDYGSELPRAVREEDENTAEVENEALTEELSSILEEIRAAGGVQLLASKTDPWDGRLARGTIPGGQERKAVLVWTDRLRAELWFGSIGKNLEGYQLMFVPYQAFMAGVLPILTKSGEQVGLNWGQEARVVGVQQFTDFLTHHLGD